MEDFAHATPEAGAEAARVALSVIQQAFEDQNVTLKRLAEKVDKLLEWKAPRVFHYQGKIIESRPLPDGKTQTEAVKIGLMVFGVAQKIDLTGNLPITVISQIERKPKPGEFKDAGTGDKPRD